jgi:soluble lytic murein transglycosylase-like protein
MTARRLAIRHALAAAGVSLLLTACGQLEFPSLPGESGVGTIPPGAVRYRATLMQAWQYYFHMGQDPAIGFGQVHQESRFDCAAVSRGGSRGCAQFTPATAEWINKMLPADVRKSCPSASGCPMDPRWALTAMVQYDWQLWNGDAWAANNRERWGFALATYNGGTVVTGAERKACAASRGCSPARYFDNVDRFCGAQGRAPAACAENRQYPRLILDQWAPMYKNWLAG